MHLDPRKIVVGHDGIVRRRLADPAHLLAQSHGPSLLHPKREESPLRHLEDVGLVHPTGAARALVRLLPNVQNLGAQETGTGEISACLNPDRGLPPEAAAVAAPSHLLVADGNPTPVRDQPLPVLGLGLARVLLRDIKEGADEEIDDTVHREEEPIEAIGVGGVWVEEIKGDILHHVLEQLNVHHLAVALVHEASEPLRLRLHEGEAVASLQADQKQRMHV